MFGGTVYANDGEFTGGLIAKSLRLKDIGNKNIIDYINDKGNVAIGGDYIDGKGIFIKNPNDKNKPYFYCTEELGKVQMNDATITGNITLDAGSYINWNVVNSDPVATNAQITANSALGAANNALDSIKSTVITGTTVISPYVGGGVVEGVAVNITGKSYTFNGRQYRSELGVYDNSGNQYGYIRYDQTTGGQYENPRRMFICTTVGKALKIQSGENMSIDANGYVYFGSRVIFSGDVEGGSINEMRTDIDKLKQEIIALKKNL